MAWQPRCFYSGNPSTTSGDTNLYTTPAGHRAVITNWNFSPSNGPADAFLYAGNSSLGIICFNRIPTLLGGVNPGAFPNASSWEFKGFYVCHPGEPIQSGGNIANGWQSVHGLLVPESEPINGRLPARFGTVSPTTTNDTNLFVAGGGGVIVKTILVSNYSGGYITTAVRGAGGAPITGWFQQIAPQEVQQHDLNLFMPAGAGMTVNVNTPNTIRFTAYGLQL